MKKSFNFVLVSALAFSLLSVTAYASNTLHVEYPESGKVHVELSNPTDAPPSSARPEPTEEVISATDAPCNDYTIEDIEHNSPVSVWYTSTEENNNFNGFEFYLKNTEDDIDHSWTEWGGDNAPYHENSKWVFTMPNKDVLVRAVFTAPTPIPSSEAIPQSNPAPSQPTPVEEPESYTPPTAEPVVPKVLSETVTFGITNNGPTLGLTTNGLTLNSQERFSATVLNLEAKDLSNQNRLAAYYSALEGKEADILVTYGIYSSKDLSYEDNGKLTTLGWKNVTSKKLDKNAKIKAVCYNTIDGTYIIEGEIDEFGNVTLKDFIIRPAKTNITIYIER